MIFFYNQLWNIFIDICRAIKIFSQHCFNVTFSTVPTQNVYVYKCICFDVRGVYAYAYKSNMYKQYA